MYKVSLIVDTDVLDAIDRSLQRSPVVTRTLVDKSIQSDIQRRLLAELRTEPGRPRYPIRWKSERQRRAFFATNGFGRGIPTQRTHQLVNNWRIVSRPITDGGVIEVQNDTPYLRYVLGSDQQPFHSDTGWYKADDVLVKYSEIATDMLIEGWFSITEDLP